MQARLCSRPIQRGFTLAMSVSLWEVLFAKLCGPGGCGTACFQVAAPAHHHAAKHAASWGPEAQQGTSPSFEAGLSSLALPYAQNIAVGLPLSCNALLQAVAACLLSDAMPS